MRSVSRKTAFYIGLTVASATGVGFLLVARQRSETRQQVDALNVHLAKLEKSVARSQDTFEEIEREVNLLDATTPPARVPEAGPPDDSDDYLPICDFRCEGSGDTTRLHLVENGARYRLMVVNKHVPAGGDLQLVTSANTGVSVLRVQTAREGNYVDVQGGQSVQECGRPFEGAKTCAWECADRELWNREPTVKLSAAGMWVLVAVTCKRADGGVVPPHVRRSDAGDDWRPED